jgi:hypothetical protein
MGNDVERTKLQNDSISLRIDALNPETFTDEEFHQILEELSALQNNDQLALKLIEKYQAATDFREQERLRGIAEEERLRRQEYLDFYDGTLFEGTYLPQKVSFFPQILSLSQANKEGQLSRVDFLKACSELSPSEVAKQYWSIHSTEYRARVQRLTEQVSAEKREKLQKCKVVVVMAAMNETELELAYQALQANYETPEQFHEEVMVMIYHNHKEKTSELDDDIAASAEDVAKHQNVVLLDEQVGPEVNVPSDVAKAKKVAADTILQLIGTGHKQLLFIDGDLRKISPKGTLQKMSSQLSIENGVLALSTTYCHDSRIDEQYPALGNYFSLSESLVLQGMSTRDDSPYTLGGFTMTDSTMFMAIGGWPISKPEDIHYTYKLRYVFQNMNVVRTVFPQVRVEMDNGREIASIIEKKSAFHRWEGQNHEEYMQISGSKRLDWQNIPTDVIADVPLLHEQDTQQAIVIAVNTNYLELVESLKNNRNETSEGIDLKLTRRVKRTLEFLRGKGIQKVKLELYPKQAESSTAQSQQLELDLEDANTEASILNNWTVSSFVSLQ